jgi:hypothetical protein
VDNIDTDVQVLDPSKVANEEEEDPSKVTKICVNIVHFLFCFYWVFPTLSFLIVTDQ